MHFAAGMIGSGSVCAAVGLFRPRVWRYLTPVMTLGGVWALLPDMPRMVREDGGMLPFFWRLGDRRMDALIQPWGDLFFLHRTLDAQPHEYALVGLGLIIFCYNAGWLLSRWRRETGIFKSSAPRWEYSGQRQRCRTKLM